MRISFCSTALRSVVGVAIIVCSTAAAVRAQSLSSPWATRDVGSPTLPGSATQASGVLTVSGAGADVWRSSDQFRFVYQQVAGDVEVVAQVDSLTSPHAWTKAGVMIRASLGAGAAHGFAAATGGRGVSFQRRGSAGGVSAATAGANIKAPVWLRAVRSGTRVTTAWSSNGSTWTTIGSDTIALGASAYVGVAVTSHNPGARATARLSNLRVTRRALPAGQRSIDIGRPAISGSASYASGAYRIRAAGADIWDTADQFHFVYQAMSGNGEIVARVASIQNVDAWSKAGVMIRESLTAASRHASVMVSAGKGYAFQRRPDPGAYSDHTSGGSGKPPGWVRLVRRGDLFEAYRSTDGRSWSRIGSDTIVMADTVYVGLAVTSHDAGAATAAVIDNLRVTGGTATNGNPAVRITAPASGVQATAPRTVAIAAAATDPEGRMSAVDFYVNGALLTRDTTAPYAASWTASGAGTYALTAVAYDADGGSSTSSAVSVTLRGANAAPTVSLTSPAASLTATAPATIALAATASDPESQLARVEFFAGATRIATDTSAPYSFNWTGVGAGTYRITAVAVDASGASATSAARSITIAAAPTPTPPTTSAPTAVVFGASSDHATNVTSYVLRVFARGANPATATPIATSDLGKPAPAANRDITVNRAALFGALAAGNYLATIVAVGPGGQTQSASVTFSR